MYKGVLFMNKELSQAFTQALEMERKGKQIYEATAAKTTNPIVKRTFTYLAQQEVNHIEEIAEYLSSKGIQLKGDTVNKTAEFFTMTISKFKEKTELSKDDIKAHETSMELEQSAFNFYKQQHDKTDNPEIKKFFKWLMQQENAHYELVRRSYEYIQDPQGFFAAEEDWFFEG